MAQTRACLTPAPTHPQPTRLHPPQVNKQTSELVFDHLHATAFQHSPLGRTILGPEGNIRTISRANLVDYMAAHYRWGSGRGASCCAPRRLQAAASGYASVGPPANAPPPRPPPNPSPGARAWSSPPRAPSTTTRS